MACFVVITEPPPKMYWQGPALKRHAPGPPRCLFSTGRTALATFAATYCTALPPPAARSPDAAWHLRDGATQARYSGTAVQHSTVQYSTVQQHN